MTKRLKHIGVEPFLAERKGLLDSYDQAKAKTADDRVKTEHGNSAERLFRDWLTQFLPKRFGVTKGYIITHNLNYNGPLEEWDILVYDALEAPVLFYKDPNSAEDRRRAIPVEYVRGVLEVKATLTPQRAKEAEVKLSHLQHFLGTNTSPSYKEYLCEPFISAAVFFETAVRNLKMYRQALYNLAILYQTVPMLPFMGALILRSQKDSRHSGYLQPIPLHSDMQQDFLDAVELSSPFSYPNGQYGALGCIAYGVNSYQAFIFDLLAFLKGVKTGRASSFYGLDFENVEGSRLFH